jgi:hypothetical protein
MMTILDGIVQAMISIFPKVRIGIKELGDEIVLKKNMILNIEETNEVRHKRASSLKTYKLQDQLDINKFGTSYKTFLIKI